MVDLESLRTQISSLGEKVKSLKTASPPDKDAIANALKELLASKKLFAENNNGIGVDGKKFEAPLSKAEKKARAKAEKAAAAAAAGGGGEAEKEKANPVGKKAANKAAAKAKKAALKSGGAAPAATSKPASSVKPKTTKAVIPRVLSSSSANMELKINPNVDLCDRAVTALTVAVLLQLDLDLKLKSDPRCATPTLGVPGGSIGGDLAIARYLCRISPRGNSLFGSSPSQQSEIDQWMDYATSLSRLPRENRMRSITKTLDHHLPQRTYLVGHKLSMADIAIYTQLGFPSRSLPSIKPSPMLRWLQTLSSLPPVCVATELALNVARNDESLFSSSAEPLVPLPKGMIYLEGATEGRVCTRFPPEPSGYLHVGHAKAVLLNDFYARRYKGRLIVRFDDTNPSKEKEEFQESIIKDLDTVKVKPDDVTHTSDYFQTIQGYALQLINQGKAFMDDTEQADMQTQRMERINSKHRDQTVDQCLKHFQNMCSGSAEGGKWCLRAKINMASDNGTMRDPVLFRQNLTPHHRTGTTYKAYPTYDLACPIVDSIEGVTHALRTTEYNDRDEQFAWLQVNLGLQRRTRIHSFARMNFMYTELSKRKLAWFVDSGLVTGWDDPRVPTVRGVLRRGVDINALRSFIYSQGASRRIVNMEWSKFWAENKREIDKGAKRFMAIDKQQNVTLQIDNAPAQDQNAYLSTDYLPKDPSYGKRVLRLSNEVLLEKGDVDEQLTIGEEIVLIRWGVVKITAIASDRLHGTYVPDGDFKAAKKKLTWLAKLSSPDENTPCNLTEFDNLISKEKLDEGDNFQDFVNPHTIATSHVLGDPGLKTLQKGEIIQLERRGYFRVDRPYISREKGIELFMVPDGKQKPMGGLEGKLAHR